MTGKVNAQLACCRGCYAVQCPMDSATISEAAATVMLTGVGWEKER